MPVLTDQHLNKCNSTDSVFINRKSLNLIKRKKLITVEKGETKDKNLESSYLLVCKLILSPYDATNCTTAGDACL